MTKTEELYLQRLGELITAKRKAMGISQETLADKVEITRNHIHRIEKGQHPTNIITLRRIAKVFEISVSELVNL